MSTIERTIMEIPLNELEGVDDMFFQADTDEAGVKS